MPRGHDMGTGVSDSQFEEDGSVRSWFWVFSPAAAVVLCGSTSWVGILLNLTTLWASVVTDTGKQTLGCGV